MRQSMPPPAKKLLDQVRDAIRVNITFKTYVQWIRRDIQDNDDICPWA
jgi:hypothetical protein